MDKPAVQPTDKPAVQPMDKPAVQPTDKPVVQPTDKPAVQPMDKPAVKLMDKPAVKLTDKRMDHSPKNRETKSSKKKLVFLEMSVEIGNEVEKMEIMGELIATNIKIEEIDLEDCNNFSEFCFSSRS